VLKRTAMKRHAEPDEHVAPTCSETTFPQWCKDKQQISMHCCPYPCDTSQNSTNHGRWSKAVELNEPDIASRVRHATWWHNKNCPGQPNDLRCTTRIQANKTYRNPTKQTRDCQATHFMIIRPHFPSSATTDGPITQQLDGDPKGPRQAKHKALSRSLNSAWHRRSKQELKSHQRSVEPHDHVLEHLPPNEGREEHVERERQRQEHGHGHHLRCAREASNLQ